MLASLKACLGNGELEVDVRTSLKGLQLHNLHQIPSLQDGGSTKGRGRDKLHSRTHGELGALGSSKRVTATMPA